MVSSPTGRLLVVNVAEPKLRLNVPSAVPSQGVACAVFVQENVTQPLGWVVQLPHDTVAVNVTDWPAFDVLLAGPLKDTLT
jgi:hypothetical protein